MTDFIKNKDGTNKENAEKKLAPFVRFGAFDPDNYKKKDLEAAVAKEEKYKPIRLMEGETIYGKITNFYTMGANGEVMYLKDVSINRYTAGGKLQLQEIEGLVKIGTTPPDIKWNLVDKKKGVGGLLAITYLGLKPSPSNKDRSLHKITME